MQLLDLTLETPEENLALDEALLENAEADCAQSTEIMRASTADEEVLRLWEPNKLMVVVGSSSRLADEVHLEVCSERGVPVLRRPSGGAAIVTGPGCLMYSLVLSYHKRPKLRSIDATHRFVLETIAESIGRVVNGIACAGISDLVIGDKKFSGNSLRCKRNHLLYHGTLLYQFPIERIGELLKMPQRQPAYRQLRGHHDFVANLPLDITIIRQSMKAAFTATQEHLSWPRELTSQLVAKKYRLPEWNERL
jgi:lipoate---protein ligase